MSADNLVRFKTESTNRYIFDCACESVSQGKPVFEIYIPENFNIFTIDEQKTLFSLLISQFESTPAFERTNRALLPVSFVDEDIVGHKISLVLNYHESQGFWLSIEGDEYILSGTSKALCASAIHKSLLKLEKILAEDQGSSLAAQ